MNVQELINKINEENFDIVEALEIKQYIPIQIKKAIAQEIVYESTENEDGVIRVDSFERYMSYVRHMILFHTNLEYTDEDYDILCSTDFKGESLLNIIMSYFGEDAKECSRILDMITGDYMQDTTLESILSKAINNINDKLSGFSQMIAEKTKEAMPDGVDIDKLGEFIKNYVQ